jgi:hypothetical protein
MKERLYLTSEIVKAFNRVRDNARTLLLGNYINSRDELERRVTLLEAADELGIENEYVNEQPSEKAA